MNVTKYGVSCLAYIIFLRYFAREATNIQGGSIYLDLLSAFLDNMFIIFPYHAHMHAQTQISNFNSSFSDGRALCYLIHHYHPSLLPLELISNETTLSKVGGYMCNHVHVHV